MAVTVNYSYKLPIVGGDLDTWGDQLDANWVQADAQLKTVVDRLVALETTRQTVAQVIALVYPIGSIFISATATNPGTFLTGTTWVAKAQGRAIVGVGSADGVAWAVNEAKGVARHTLAANEMPVHAHIADPPAQAFTSGTASANHTHGVNQSAHGHGVSQSPHAHGYSDNGHTHGYVEIMGNSGTGASGEAYDAGPYRFHDQWRQTNAAGIGISISGANANISIDPQIANVSIAADGWNHTHNTTVDLNAFWTQNTGGGASHENLQPSIGLYIWERTA